MSARSCAEQLVKLWLTDTACVGLLLQFLDKTKTGWRMDEPKNKIDNPGKFIIGRREGGDPESEVEHVQRCRSCGQNYDKRDLGQVVHHDTPGHEALPQSELEEVYREILKVRMTETQLKRALRDRLALTDSESEWRIQCIKDELERRAKAAPAK